MSDHLLQVSCTIFHSLTTFFILSNSLLYVLIIPEREQRQNKDKKQSKELNKNKHKEKKKKQTLQDTREGNNKQTKTRNKKIIKAKQSKAKKLRKQHILNKIRL